MLKNGLAESVAAGLVGDHVVQLDEKALAW